MDLIQNIIKKVRETISRYRMTVPGDTVITAVSGGPDSLCLLDVLSRLSGELDIRLVVAHFDHGLRGSEDESETRLVKEIATTLGLAFETEKAALLDHGDFPSEERARDARYLFLERVRKKHAAQRIALGHTLNDQAETVIMRMLRGSGPLGLAGIPPKRDDCIIRPLIDVKREEIIAYLHLCDYQYAMDISNEDKRYLRNRIRHELLPSMMDCQPRIIEHLGRLSGLLRDEDRFMETMVAEWVNRENKGLSEDRISLSIKPFKKLHIAFQRRVVRHLLKDINMNLRRIDHGHIDSIIDLSQSIKPQAEVDLPNGLRIIKRYGLLIFSAGQKPRGRREFSYKVEGPGTFHLEKIDRTIKIEDLPDMKGLPDSIMGDTAFIDAGNLKFPLTLRGYRPGDKFIPLGMKGHKKIKDFFIDLKVPYEIRALTPVLLSQDKPVWICGYRIDDRFKVTPETKKILRITISPLSHEV